MAPINSIERLGRSSSGNACYSQAAKAGRIFNLRSLVAVDPIAFRKQQKESFCHKRGTIFVLNLDHELLLEQ